jgi:hypothetical protein
MSAAALAGIVVIWRQAQIHLDGNNFLSTHLMSSDLFCPYSLYDRGSALTFHIVFHEY